ncbi:MAG: hypothetical protein PHI63_06775, partial [Patescibacteria group bacterium]|nr:hypothetical protein [Patescibacteria group bacterium]
IKETHVAFLGLDRYMGKPLTIIKWQKIHPADGQPRFYSYPDDCYWHKDEKFANQPTCGFRWYLMPLQIVPDSESKTYQDQVAMLPAEYEVPFAVEEVGKCLLYHRKNGTFLNPNQYGRCQDVSLDGLRVDVGRFDFGGLVVDGWADEERLDGVGVAASRKYPNLVQP